MISIYNKINDYIIVINYTGKIIFCNESFLRKLKYNKEDILGLNIYEILKNGKTIGTDLVKLNDKDKRLEFYCKSNEIVKVDCNITRNYFNKEEGIFLIGKEVDTRPYTMEMLEDLLDNINLATFITDEDNKYLYVNKVFSNILNLKRDDIIGNSNTKYWHKDIHKEFQQNNKEVLKNRNPKIFDEKLVVNDNTYWYKSYRCPIYDENNKFKYIVATTENINLSKTISEELYRNFNSSITTGKYNTEKNEHMNLRKILNNIGENILDYTGADGVSIMMYDRKKEHLMPYIKIKNSKNNLKKIKFIPIKVKDIYSEEYKDYFNVIHSKEKLKELFPNVDMDMYEFNYIGSYIMELSNEFMGVINLNYGVGNSPKYNNDEYMKHICNKIAMITKNIRLSNQVIMENRMRKYTEKELEQYLNVSVDLVSILDEDGHLKRVSPNWSNVLGWTEKELLSMCIKDILHEEEVKKIDEWKLSSKTDNKVTRNIIRFKHKKGHYVHIEWSSMYVSSEGIYVTAGRDITKDIEIEKEKTKLEEAIQFEIVKNEFFSNISHEFRTPINILIGTMQLINKNIEKNHIDMENLRKYTRYIKQNSYRLLRLVNNLIDISKMDIGMYELRSSNQNIINIIEEITLSVADYTKDNNINLIFDTTVEELITCCDPDKIERIMLNLLSNAIKYTPENGCIQVDVDVLKNHVIVSVKDSGVGIPKDKQNVIFDRFGQVDGSFNRKCEGSGIGLSLVKNLVEMHGGKITVKSKVNEGSQFIFTIPIKLTDENIQVYDYDRKSNHVERCDIEFSDIYSV